MIDTAKLRQTLIDLAERQQCITYLQLIKRCDISPPRSMQTLTCALEVLALEDSKLNYPILSSIVIQKGNAAIPRDGFFMQLAELDLYQGPTQGSQATMFHAQLLDEVWRYWGKKTNISTQID
jgi:hypothetical protein